MLLVWRLAIWSAVVALVSCGYNTPEEIREGKAALEGMRRERKREEFAANRIFGGFQTHVGLYPFAVYLITKDKQGYEDCSGSLVAPGWVLTARHCKGTGGWDAIVFAGDVDFSTDRVFTKINVQIRVAATVSYYKPPTPDRLDHDIMLLHMYRAFEMVSGFVGIIPVTEMRQYPEHFNERCTVVGFGLRGKDLKPETGIQKGASFMMEPGPNCRFPGIDINGLCTFDVATKSVCRGDSGGPVFCKGEQIQMGLVVGAKYKNCCFEWCGAPVWKNVHMFVGYYRDWIEDAITPGAREHANRSGSHAVGTPLLVSLAGLAACLSSCSVKAPLLH
ncbi:chymase-like [Schistocerca gregaria]|uniref:chymase-like n=1 Tax=Schistocerca gregaria TaxID=7010 RepID=UPI00211E870E|nr:chymase-like [Schistocerca gregaria]